MSRSAQRLPGSGGLTGQRVEMRPRRLGIDVVLRHRRDAAPVVDPRRNQLRQRAGAQIGRRLDVRVRAEEDARDCDGPEQLIQAWLRCRGHARPRLGPEILNDDLLDVPVVIMGIAEREQGLDPLLSGFADADEDTGGERHRLLAGQAERLEPCCRPLVRRAVVRPALGGEPLGRALEHHALRGGDRTQRAQVFAAQHTRIEVRQQRRLLQHQLRHGREVGQRTRKTQGFQVLPRGAIS